MEYWLWLSRLPYIGPKTANRLLEYFGEPKRVYCAEPWEFRKVKGITNRQVESIINNKSLEEIWKIIDSCQKDNISILLKSDVQYPTHAKILEDAPIVLYYKGHIEDRKETVAIVGARRCSQEIKFYTIELAERYTKKGSTIISGMAKGIDSYAHTACSNIGGYTIAVLGNGLDICYPSEHKKLMDCISDNGLLLSEYPPGIKPTKYTFPQRNRLISAWSEHIVVIAPGKGSGALITAEFARKYGRKLDIILQEDILSQHNIQYR